MEEKPLSEYIIEMDTSTDRVLFVERVKEAVERLKEWAKPFETIDERDLQNWIKEIFGDLS